MRQSVHVKSTQCIAMVVTHHGCMRLVVVMMDAKQESA